jgi:hypothetical protein
MLRYPNRSLADWQPDKAVAEAEHDLAAGAPKIYISGTMGSFAPGISSETYQSPEKAEILRTLPCADAGMGCVIEDMELREAQFEYARRYNEHVVQHLLKR